MKKLFFILFFFFCHQFFFAHQGKLFGEKNLQVAKTKYFQIIYPPACIESAAVLYENADRIYEEVAASFNDREPYLKLFVVLTSKPQAYQGVYDDLPFPRILICDTARRDQTLSFCDDVLLNFRNEITRTYSRTVRSPFWKMLGFDFGFLWTTTGITEGEAIVSESSDGVFGRMNDEYFKHVVKQAKIENAFPKFSDVQGMHNAFRADAYKNFNAMFTQYIQQKHGMEKYYEWLYKMTNLRTLTVRQAFKKFYGVGLNEEWKNFCDELNYDFVKTDFANFGIEIFFSEEKNLNECGMFFSHLQNCETGIYFLDLDSSCVYFLPKENPAKLKKIFYKEGVTSISVSQDGRFIAVSYDTEFAANTKARLAVFDAQNKKWFFFEQTGLFNNAIVQRKNEYFILSTTYSHKLYKTEIFRLDFSKKKAALVPASKIEFGENQFPVCYCPHKNGFAFVLKDKNEFSICTSEFLDDTQKIERHFFSENLFIKNLSSDLSGENLCFSYAQKNSMPRLGIFNAQKNQVLLEETDFSGGVFFPIQIEEKIVYAANFFREGKIFFRKTSSIQNAENSKIIIPTTVGFIKNADEKNSLQNKISFLKENSKKLRTADMYKKWMVIPFALTASRDHVPNYSAIYWNLWGVSMFGADPWEESHLNLFAGYGFETNSVIFRGQYSSGTGTEIFKYNLESNSEFDGYGWKLSNAGATFSSKLPLEKNFAFEFALDFFSQYGRRNKKNYSLDSLSENVFNVFSEIKNYARTLRLNSAKSDDLAFYLYNTSEFTVKFSHIQNVGNGRYEKAGFFLGADLYYILNERSSHGYEKSQKEIFEERLDLGFEAAAYFPGFFRNAKAANRFTYTLPAKFIFGFFPMDFAHAANASLYAGSLSDALDKSDLIFSAYGELILFSTEIQKAIAGIQIAYLNEFKISLTGYDFLFDAYAKTNRAISSPYFYHYKNFSKYFSGEIKLENWFLLGLRAELEISANFGVFCGNELMGRFFSEIIFGVAGTSGFNWAVGFEMKY